ncbi:hypothetical protein Mmc1_0361 [Magnetococcus marinus MC-1]|uniref:Uncharacterized protein n=1 Tax=Magnetococcus marinus (strain ATCC BAA-1437 / JCM 17883 / MC-1) TaxID=156889 RepID=A0L4J4_MAGMM|nr:hypothetical protein [Magnetococcus marinus]ABK42887.1 hypothetical protein Mmc1_0361 [Magnetococcus marinus MC-1]
MVWYQNDPTFTQFVDALCDHADPVEVARGHNFRHDERIDKARAAEYLAHMGKAPVGHQSCAAQHASYCAQYVRDAITPATFLPSNRAALLGPFDDGVMLIRVERLDKLLALISESNGESADDAFARLRQAMEDYQQRKDNEAERALKGWIARWNEKRDARPAFVTIGDEMASYLRRDDWVVALRDQLGLAHFSGAPGKPIYLALMAYPVQDVKTQAAKYTQLSSPFVAPTVLDADMWEYFFPAPVDRRATTLSYGRAMSLQPLASEEQLQVEMLHTRVDYQLAHVRQLGQLETPRPEHPVEELRNAHLDGVRMVTERYDWGEEIRVKERLDEPTA